MFDFKLTKTGDIEFSNEKPISKFHLMFSLSDYKSQRIKFLTIPETIPEKRKSAQRITFRTVPSSEIYAYNENNIENFEESLQAIMIGLRTELTDTLDYNIGSNMYKTRHNIYTGNKEDLSNASSIANEVVHSILPDASVRVEYGEHESGGYFQYQCLIITIEYGDKSETIYMY